MSVKKEIGARRKEKRRNGRLQRERESTQIIRRSRTTNGETRARADSRQDREKKSCRGRNTNCSVIRGFNSETVVCWTDHVKDNIYDARKKRKKKKQDKASKLLDGLIKSKKKRLISFHACNNANASEPIPFVEDFFYHAWSWILFVLALLYFVSDDKTVEINMRMLLLGGSLST